MPTWSADQYLKFADERTQPCRDLAARIVRQAVRRVIDLGCGPGNSTAVLGARWPSAEIVGFDSSPGMIDSARQSQPTRKWIIGDIVEWAHQKGAEQFDVVFANASLQWIPDHAANFPRLLARVAPGGAFAAQLPGNHEGPTHQLMRDMAASPRWRRWFPTAKVREWQSSDLAYYYDVLAPHAARLDMWETAYLHIFSGAEDIVEWYKGSGMRPYLEAIDAEEDRKRFIAEYLDGIRELYPPRSNGRVLFPFRRLFMIAYRTTD
ncbi:MAG: trans-aconitate 2-methyltransferase [Candidatus Acidiferrales bacterium]